MQKFRHFIYGVLAIATSITLCAVVGELSLRWLGFRQPSWEQGDGLLGFRPNANKTVNFTFPEHPFVSKTNNMAFFEDHDTPVHKPAGITRVVVLGDSQTAGLCVNRESYPHRLQALLNSPGRCRYEVINAGTGRYSPYQYYVKAVHDILALEPDHIIVGMYIGNDIMDLTRQDDRPYLTFENGRVSAHPPLFIVYKDPGKEPSLLESSRLYALFQKVFGSQLHYQITRATLLYHDASAQRRNPVEIAKYMWDVKRLNDISNGLMVASLHQYNWFRWYPETLPVAMRLNKEVMKMFRDLCAQHGIGLTYVLVPTKPRIEPELLQPLLATVHRYDRTFNIHGLQDFEDRIARQTEKDGAELGIPVIDATPYILEHRQGREMYYRSDMHLTAAGNQVLAEAIANGLPSDPCSVNKKGITKHNAGGVSKESSARSLPRKLTQAAANQ